MSDIVDADFIRNQLAVEANTDGGTAKLARKIGVSYAFLYNVMAGNKLPGDKVLAHLGYEKVQHEPAYRRIERSEA